MTFRLLVADPIGQAGLERLAEDRDVRVESRTDMSRQELLDIIGEFDALIVRSSTQVDAELLAAARSLRVVGRAGVGVDNVDVKAATARGVIVMNTPQANTIATAEHSMALMLAVARHVPQAHRSLAGGEWKRTAFTGMQLYRKTLGLIGFGRVARQVAARAQAFGMQVIAYDPYVSEEIGRECNVGLVELDELLAEADFISLHTALSPETENILNAESLALCKTGVTIVNAARGRLIDEQALAEALACGRVRAAAVDVFRSEPPGSDHPLLGLPNVVHTPHLGASTEEAQRDVAVQIVEQVLDALRNRDFRNSVNMPFAAGPEFLSVLPYMALAEKIGALQFHMAPGPVRRFEIELKGDGMNGLARPVAAGCLKGYMENFLSDSVNFVNAPVLAQEHGISVSQSKGLADTEFAKLVSCRVHWDDGSRVISGTLSTNNRPRIVQVSQYHLDIDPNGVMLLMLNQDTPGVIGQVGTILGAYGVNIGEWRMGRREKGTEALSFISLDSEPPAEVLAALEKVAAITKLNIVRL